MKKTVSVFLVLVLSFSVLCVGCAKEKNDQNKDNVEILSASQIEDEIAATELEADVHTVPEKTSSLQNVDESGIESATNTAEEIRCAVLDLFNGDFDYGTFQKQYCLQDKEVFYDVFCRVLYSDWYEGKETIEYIKEEYEDLDSIKSFYERAAEEGFEKLTVEPAEKADQNEPPSPFFRTAFERAYPDVELYEIYVMDFRILYKGDGFELWTQIIIADTENGFVILGGI